MKMSQKIIVALLFFLVKILEVGTETRFGFDHDSKLNNTELWTKFTLVVKPDKKQTLLTTERNGVVYTTNRSLPIPTPTPHITISLRPQTSKWTNPSPTTQDTISLRPQTSKWTNPSPTPQDTISLRPQTSKWPNLPPTPQDTINLRPPTSKWASPSPTQVTISPRPQASKWTKVAVTLPPKRTSSLSPTTASTLNTLATQKPSTTLSTIAVTNRSVALPELRRRPDKKERQDDIFYDDEDEDEEYEDEEEEEEIEEAEEDDEEAQVVEVEKVDYETYSEEPPTIVRKKKKRKRKRGKKNSIKLKDFKKLKKFMLPLLLAYKLKFFTLVPLLLGGLVLIVGTTGFAGFFFALFAVGLGLKHH